MTKRLAAALLVLLLFDLRHHRWLVEVFSFAVVLSLLGWFGAVRVAYDLAAAGHGALAVAFFAAYHVPFVAFQFYTRPARCCW